MSQTDGKSLLAAILEEYEEAKSPSPGHDEFWTSEHQKLWDDLETCFDGLLKKSAETKLKSAENLLKLIDLEVTDNLNDHKGLLKKIVNGFTFTLTSASEDDKCPPAVSAILVECANLLFGRFRNNLGRNCLAQLVTSLHIYKHVRNPEVSRKASSTLNIYFPESNLEKKIKLYNLIVSACITKYQRILDLAFDQIERNSAPTETLSPTLNSINEFLEFLAAHDNLGDVGVTFCRSLVQRKLPILSNQDYSAGLRIASIQLSLTIVRILSEKVSDFQLPSNYVKLVSKLFDSDPPQLLISRCAYAKFSLVKFPELVQDSKIVHTLIRRIAIAVYKSGSNREVSHLKSLIEIVHLLMSPRLNDSELKLGGFDNSDFDSKIASFKWFEAFFPLILLCFLRGVDPVRLEVTSGSRLVWPGNQMVPYKDPQGDFEALMLWECVCNYLEFLFQIEETRNSASVMAVSLLRLLGEACAEELDSRLEGTLLPNLKHGHLSPKLPLRDSVARWIEIGILDPEVVFATVGDALETVMLGNENLEHCAIETAFGQLFHQCFERVPKGEYLKRSKVLLERVSYTANAADRQEFVLKLMDSCGDLLSPAFCNKTLHRHIHQIITNARLDDLAELDLVRNLLRSSRFTEPLDDDTNPILALASYFEKLRDLQRDLQMGPDASKISDVTSSTLKSEVPEFPTSDFVLVFSRTNADHYSREKLLSEIFSAPVDRDVILRGILERLVEMKETTIDIHAPLISALDKFLREKSPPELMLLASILDAQRPIIPYQIASAVSELMKLQEECQIGKILIAKCNVGEFDFPSSVDSFLERFVNYSYNETDSVSGRRFYETFILHNAHTFLSIPDNAKFFRLRKLFVEVGSVVSLKDETPSRQSSASAADEKPPDSKFQLALLLLRSRTLRCLRDADCAVYSCISLEPTSMDISRVWDIQDVESVTPLDSFTSIETLMKTASRLNVIFTAADFEIQAEKKLSPENLESEGETAEIPQSGTKVPISNLESATDTIGLRNLRNLVVGETSFVAMTERLNDLAEKASDLEAEAISSDFHIDAFWTLSRLLFFLRKNEERVDWKTLMDLHIPMCEESLFQLPELKNLLLQIVLYSVHTGNFWTNADYSEVVFDLIIESPSALADLGELFYNDIRPWFLHELIQAVLEPSSCLAVLESVSLLLSPMMKFFSRLLKSECEGREYAFWDMSISEIVKEYETILVYFRHQVDLEAMEKTFDLTVLKETRTNIASIISVFCNQDSYVKLPQGMVAITSVLLNYPFNRFPILDFRFTAAERRLIGINLREFSNPEELGFRVIQKSVMALGESEAEIAEVEHGKSDLVDGCLFQLLSMIFGSDLSWLMVALIIGREYEKIQLPRIAVLISIFLKAAEPNLAESIPEWSKQYPVDDEASAFEEFAHFTNRLEFGVQLIFSLPRKYFGHRSIRWMPLDLNLSGNEEPETLVVEIDEIFPDLYAEETSIASNLLDILLDECWLAPPPSTSISDLKMHPRKLTFALPYLCIRKGSTGRFSLMQNNELIFSHQRNSLVSGVAKLTNVGSTSDDHGARSLLACLLYLFPDECRRYNSSLSNRHKKLVIQKALEDPTFVKTVRENLGIAASVLNSLYSGSIFIQYDGICMTVTLRDSSGESDIKLKIDTDIKGFPLSYPSCQILNPQMLQSLAPKAPRTYIVAFTRSLQGMSVVEPKELSEGQTTKKSEELRAEIERKYHYGGQFNIMFGLLHIRSLYTNLFAGTSDCLICYSIIQKETKQLPQNRCGSCGNVFHSHCLQR
eukprot:Gregarina_sp_Poly_1__10092@NODE_683_length_6795_cov_40_427913_g515_i0_p1_GENE_NODE_683_length_6795_cov_40_427913_g515_i0NODE_683_length_6795_cov_40_427913_g515_i0_p1_ORF_typecomplete_len1781_score275_24FANCL_C/PF11793_8/0_00081zfRING_2/PF13639_6/0_027zfANAPC11/PF12861_7/0_06Npa1/PF11707_8/0_13Npa1/PF11707_8/6_8e02ProkRING_1/PF14446_6/0_58zfC3HC4_2/PF13923_6/1_3zfrbx1/PF12678_7/1_5_NODE_683_length_6795_cov_40_427913_g515_i0205362